MGGFNVAARPELAGPDQAGRSRVIVGRSGPLGGAVGPYGSIVARNRAIDRLRRESTRHAREREAMTLHDPAPDPPAELGDIDTVPDDQLRLIFLCCHPALGADAQVALTLRLLGGLTAAEIARAFLVPEPTMAQRLSRAKRKIRDTHVAYRIPAAGELPERLAPVLATVYLIYTEGHSATAGDDLLRPALTGEAIRIGRTLVALLPDEPEAVGLLALMVLTEARAPARLGADGELVRRAIAVMEHRGPAAALDALDEIDLPTYHLFHADARTDRPSG